MCVCVCVCVCVCARARGVMWCVFLEGGGVFVFVFIIAMQPLATSQAKLDVAVSACTGAEVIDNGEQQLQD